MIPRTTHVIRVGGAPMPEKRTACLERNREVLSHYVQLRRGGRFIGTFDLPGLQLEAVEDFVDEKIVTDCVA
jgi:hypothetical protein